MYICRSHNGWYGNIFSRFFSQARLTMNEEWACCKIFYTLKILKIVPAICASRPLFNVFIQKMLKFERRIHKQLLLVQQWVWLLDLQNFDSFLFRLFEIISISYIRMQANRTQRSAIWELIWRKSGPLSEYPIEYRCNTCTANYYKWK